MCCKKQSFVEEIMDYEVEGARTRDRPNKISTETVEKDCKACKLNKDDGMDDTNKERLMTTTDVSECFF